MAIKDFFRKGCERVQHYAHFVDLRFQGKGFLLSCLANPLAFMKLLTFSLFFSMLFIAIRIAEVQSFAKALSSRSFESKFYSSSGTLPKTF